MHILIQMIESNPGVDLWGSLPCGPWSQWQSLSLHQYSASFVERLDEQQAKSRELLKRFCRLAKIVIRNGDGVTYEWPRHCDGLRGMPGGAPWWSGELHLKKWRLATTCGLVARIFSRLRCDHPKHYKHAPIAGSKARRTGFYTRLMCEYVMYAMYPDICPSNASYPDPWWITAP